MKDNGLDTTWWENVKLGKQYPWTRLQELDVNGQMKQFNMKTDHAGRVIEITTDERANVK
jgi:hypothetical protein